MSLAPPAFPAARAFAVSGCGNDFLALVEPERDPCPEEIAAWCARGLSLGADGVFALRRIPHGAAMSYWNADGHPAALCVNGTRCAARLAIALGWAEAGAEELVIETGAGPLAARRAGATAIALELPPPDRLPRFQRVELAASGPEPRALEGWVVVVGVPHFVVPWSESLGDCPVSRLGAAARRHPDFAPGGTNVDFVRYPDTHRMEIRSFERGVEAETLACGSGVLAAVAAGLQASHLRLPVTALTRGGFELTVEGVTVGSAPSRWTLAGDARVLAELTLGAEAALAPPTPPRWSS